MGIVGTLNAERMGTWTSVLAYLQDLNRRETGSLAALAAALAAPPAEQKELAEGDGMLVLADVAGDQRVQKGARLAAVRCAVEAGVDGPVLATLFVGGGELAADPRLGATAKKLVETGLPAVLADPQHPTARVSLQAGAFARAAHVAASVVGLSRFKELVAPAGAAHAGVNAALFALGQGPLPAGELDAWKKLLKEGATAFKRAPPAAKRLGLTQLWPPILPEAFKDLIAEAEAATANVVAIDATKGGVIKGTAGSGAAPQPPPGKQAPPAPGKKLLPTAPPIMARTPRAGSLGAPLPTASARPAPPPPSSKPAPSASAPAKPAPQEAPAQVQAKVGAAIKPQHRRPIGSVVEGKDAKIIAPTRALPAMSGQFAAGHEIMRDAPRVHETDLTPGAKKAAPLPGLSPLPSVEAKPLEFDLNGRKMPAVPRWEETDRWEEPLLPSSELRPPLRASIALGPFAKRMKALVDDRPEAVERLCAAAEARALLAGMDALERELRAEATLPRWRKPLSAEQLARLKKVSADADRPESWRRASALVLSIFLAAQSQQTT